MRHAPSDYRHDWYGREPASGDRIGGGKLSEEEQRALRARVADGETLVISGLTRDREVRERKNVGTRGGWFGRGTVATRKRVEMLILLTPRIVAGVATQ